MKGDLMDRISVIIRNRNEEQYIGFAIQSVLDHFNKPEIIIVDNNSNKNDQVIGQLSLIGNVKIIFNDQNSGYSIGNNIAFSNSSGNTIVLSNPDVEFSIDALDKLLSNLRIIN